MALGRDNSDKGYNKAMDEDGKGADPAALAEAERLGKVAAQQPPDAEVTCPYPEGTALYNAWLQSFTKHGGEHIEIEPNPDGR